MSKFNALIFNLMKKSLKIIIEYLLIFIISTIISDIYAQGFGLGTNSPTEILHIYKSGGDAAIRFQTQTTGTGQLSVGPSSPTANGNDASIGTVAWSNRPFAMASDNSYATVANATSNYLSLTNFGFAIPGGATIDGIEVSIEKSRTDNKVAILDDWTSNNTDDASDATYTAYTAYNVTGGTNRLLVVCISANDNAGGGIRDIVSVQYGGQNMTEAIHEEDADGYDFYIFYLLETGIALGDVGAGGGNVVIDWSDAANSIDSHTSFIASFQYVDQTSPIDATSNSVYNASTSTHVVAVLTVKDGDYVVAALGIDNDGRAVTGPAGYTQDDVENADSGSDVLLSVFGKAILVDGTETPSVSWTGGPDIAAFGAIVLQSNRQVIDNEVKLIKTGVVSGNNNADLATDWSTTDASAIYGSNSDLWGLAWTDANINAANFGIAISATANNSTAQIDNVTVTIYYTSVPASYSNWVSGIDYSDGGKYKLSYNSSLGTNDFLTIDATGNSVFTGTVTASCGVLSCSDFRYKKNIVSIKGALSKIKLLNGVNYYWKKDEFPEKHFTEEKQIGLIAQELEKIYPELVQTDANGYKTVDYSHITPILIEAIKEQQIIIEELKNNVNNLSSKIEITETLENRINSLESSIKALTELLNLSSSSNK